MLNISLSTILFLLISENSPSHNYLDESKESGIDFFVINICYEASQRWVWGGLRRANNYA